MLIDKTLFKTKVWKNNRLKSPMLLKILHTFTKGLNLKQMSKLTNKNNLSSRKLKTLCKKRYKKLNNSQTNL